MTTQSLQIKNLKLQSNLIQGPLAGISCAPFRLLAWEYGKPGLCYTEMISAKTVINTRKLDKRYLWRHPNEGPLGYQLSGNSPAELAEATKIINDTGKADTIDLNCGCPKPKIRRKNAGSALLENSNLLSQIITAMRRQTDLPLSIKIRLSGEKANHKIIKVAEEAGVDFITVHGRYWTDDYETPCHLDELKSICENAKVPIIANGDIDSPSSLQKMLTTTKCDGVMISRASIGRPWIFRELQDPNYQPLAFNEVKAIFDKHITMLSELIGEKHALLQARRLIKHYFCGKTQGKMLDTKSRLLPGL